MSIKHLEAYEAANETAARIDAMVELKRLAEGATQGEWRYGPGDGDDENPVVFVDLPQASAVAISILFEADWATDVDAKFVSKANPATVLALIAENEKLKSHNDEMSGMREVHGFKSWASVLVEITELRTDAARYRWLREFGFKREIIGSKDQAPGRGPFIQVNLPSEGVLQTAAIWNEAADNAIDDAMNKREV